MLAHCILWSLFREKNGLGNRVCQHCRQFGIYIVTTILIDGGSRDLYYELTGTSPDPGQMHRNLFT